MANPGNRDYVAIALKYAQGVTKKKIVAGLWVRLACKRFLKDYKRNTSARWFPYYFDDWHANDVCDFIEKLPHVEGEWHHATLVLEPWEVFILVNVFGFRQAFGDAQGKRRFNTAYIELARKNGKSALTSGVALYCLTCEEEPGPQVKTAATTGDQARIVFDVAKAMVEKTPDLAEAFQLEPMANAVVCKANMGSIQPINAKASTQDGLNPHLTVIDELHAHTNRKLFDVLKSARGARKNPLSWYITTAGYNLATVCYEQRTLVTKILQDVLNADHYFGIIFTLDEGDDAFDEAVWVKANPNLGISVSLKEMRTYAQEARESAGSEGEFKTKRCNLWLNAANAWLSMVDWEKCADRELRLEDMKAFPAYIGGDLADRNDVVSLAIVFDRGNDLVAFCWHYLPKEIVQAAADRTSAHYSAWASQGFLILTEGDMTDYSAVEAHVRQLFHDFDVRRITFDQFGSAQMTSNMVEDGLPAQVMTKNAKNYTDPSKELEARVQVKRFKHTGDPVLKWMASNCVVTKGVDGSILPKKESKDSPNKIDGMDAVINGITGYLQDRNETFESVYAERAVH